MKASRSYAKRLSRRLIGETSILFLAAMSVVVVVSYVSSYDVSISDSKSILKSTSLEIESMLSGTEAATRNCTWLLDRYSSDENMLRLVMQNLAEADSNIVSSAVGLEPGVFNPDVELFCPVAFCDSTGKARTEVLGGQEYDYLDMDWYLIPKLLGQPYWGDPTFDNNLPGLIVASYSIPLYRSDGTFFGVVKSDIDVSWLIKKVRSMKPYEHSYTLLAGRNATVISRLDGSTRLDRSLFTYALENDDKELVQLFQKMVSGQTGYYRLKKEGFRGLFVYGSLNNHWPVALMCMDADILYSANRFSMLLLLIAIFSVLGLYLRCRKVIDRESKAVAALSYTALSIAQGNFSAIIPEVKTKDELKRLHDSLTYLENSISKYIGELRSTTEANERYESELNIASAIQMQMLPKDYPHFDGVDLYATLHPAKEVGGDLYDFFVKDRMLYFAVGDVSGKGVPAALYMAITRSAFRFIAGLGLPVSGVVSRINNSFCEGNDSGMFVTMFVARLNLDTLQMDFCNAGHNPILVVSADGKASYLHAKANLAAGLFEDFPYQGESISLEKGSRLLIYTDGVTEAEDVGNNLYGEQRLESFASSQPAGEPSEEFVEKLVKDIRQFTNGNVQNDDITIMSIGL